MDYFSKEMLLKGSSVMSQSGKTVTVTEEELAPCMCHVVAAQGDGDTPDAAGLGATWWLSSSFFVCKKPVFGHCMTLKQKNQCKVNQSPAVKTDCWGGTLH